MYAQSAFVWTSAMATRSAVGSVTTRTCHGSNPGRFVVVASHASNVSRSRTDHSRKASSWTVQTAWYSASVAARTAYPSGSGRSGTDAPAGSWSTQLVQRTR